MATDLNSLPSGIRGTLYTEGGISIVEMNDQEGRDDFDGGSTASRKFLISGSNDPAVCRDRLTDPSSVSHWSLDEYDGLFFNTVSRERVSDDQWIFTATYSELQPTVGKYTVSIDTSGQTATRTIAIAQATHLATGQTSNHVGQLGINVQGAENGADVEGIDVIIPSLKVTVQARISTDIIGDQPQDLINYSKLIARLTGTVNNAAYLGFAQGELLFAGANGQLIGKDPNLQFIFLASENVTGGTFGGITPINKGGHEYLWYELAETPSAVGGPTTTIRAAHVAQVYNETDFTALEIGVSPP